MINQKHENVVLTFPKKKSISNYEAQAWYIGEKSVQFVHLCGNDFFSWAFLRNVSETFWRIIKFHHFVLRVWKRFWNFGVLFENIDLKTSFVTELLCKCMLKVLGRQDSSIFIIESQSMFRTSNQNVSKSQDSQPFFLYGKSKRFMRFESSLVILWIFWK